jgi:transposase
MSGHDQERRFAIVAETRRKWSRAEKEAMVAETKIAGASVSSVARKHGVAASLLFRWRREFGSGGKMVKPVPEPRFVPIALPAPSTGYAPATVTNGGLIEIELVGGQRLRVDASVDAAALKRVIAVLDER